MKKEWLRGDKLSRIPILSSLVTSARFGSSPDGGVPHRSATHPAGSRALSAGGAEKPSARSVVLRVVRFRVPSLPFASSSGNSSYALSRAPRWLPNVDFHFMECETFCLPLPQPQGESIQGLPATERDRASLAGKAPAQSNGGSGGRRPRTCQEGERPGCRRSVPRSGRGFARNSIIDAPTSLPSWRLRIFGPPVIKRGAGQRVGDTTAAATVAARAVQRSQRALVRRAGGAACMVRRREACVSRRRLRHRLRRAPAAVARPAPAVPGRPAAAPPLVHHPSPPRLRVSTAPEPSSVPACPSSVPTRRPPLRSLSASPPLQHPTRLPPLPPPTTRFLAPPPLLVSLAQAHSHSHSHSHRRRRRRHQRVRERPAVVARTARRAQGRRLAVAPGRVRAHGNRSLKTMECSNQTTNKHKLERALANWVSEPPNKDIGKCAKRAWAHLSQIAWVNRSGRATEPLLPYRTHSPRIARARKTPAGAPGRRAGRVGRAGGAAVRVQVTCSGAGGCARGGGGGGAWRGRSRAGRARAQFLRPPRPPARARARGGGRQCLARCARGTCPGRATPTRRDATPRGARLDASPAAAVAASSPPPPRLHRSLPPFARPVLGPRLTSKSLVPGLELIPSDDCRRPLSTDYLVRLPQGGAPVAGSAIAVAVIALTVIKPPPSPLYSSVSSAKASNFFNGTARAISATTASNEHLPSRTTRSYRRFMQTRRNSLAKTLSSRVPHSRTLPSCISRGTLDVFVFDGSVARLKSARSFRSNTQKISYVTLAFTQLVKVRVLKETTKYAILSATKNEAQKIWVSILLRVFVQKKVSASRLLQQKKGQGMK
ncbi:Protein of unknown function [Gryllus bimaculatus]|nr:Protein of unknown function [Gryllus bimaculatus]